MGHYLFRDGIAFRTKENSTSILLQILKHIGTIGNNRLSHREWLLPLLVFEIKVFEPLRILTNNFTLFYGTKEVVGDVALNTNNGKPISIHAFPM
jgi:hypothetical protein